MEMHLQPLATTCCVSGEPFVEGARVASYLVRSGAALEIVRYDVLEPHAATFVPDGQIACRWVQAYKPRKQGENTDRALKLTAENLFVALADPQTEPTTENTRLVQFLALMLERKKILKPRGRSADGLRNRFEHAKSKQIFEVPAGELTPEFFVAVQEQLSVLVGTGKKVDAAATATATATATAAAAATAENTAKAASEATAGTNVVAPAEESSATAVEVVAVSEGTSASETASSEDSMPVEEVAGDNDAAAGENDDAIEAEEDTIEADADTIEAAGDGVIDEDTIIDEDAVVGEDDVDDEDAVIDEDAAPGAPDSSDETKPRSVGDGSGGTAAA